MNLAAIMQEVGNWSVEDRLQLIEEVWDSLSGSSTEFQLTDAQKQDLQRRLDAHRDDPKAGSPWEEVEARLRGPRR